MTMRLEEYLSMEDSEKIKGKKAFDLLAQLKDNHTILNIHVMGTNFDGLSIILGLSDGESPCFFIDYPGRYDSVAPLAEGKKCYFEFSDEGKIRYSFKTTVFKIIGNRIKFLLPEYIERTQRRKSFRIPAPYGTRLICFVISNRLEFDITDISEGGLLAGTEIANHIKKFIYKSATLNNLSISYKEEEVQVKIKVKAAEIVRLEKIKESGRYSYGIKFTEIIKEEQDELKKFIYYCQRKVLKKRGGLDD